MNLITVFVILLLIWLLYKLTTTYDKLSKELREIRVKCVQTPSSTA